jgi:hypothetical protein
MPARCRAVLRSAFAAAVLMLALAASSAQGLRPGSAEDLRGRYLALRPQLERSALGGPVHIESTETPNSGRGDVYAVLSAPIGTVTAALGDPEHWCDVLMLHLNNKSCLIRRAGAATQLELRIGRTYAQPAAGAARVLFAWHALPAAPDFLSVQLDSPDGPFDTHDYRILLEAVALDGERSFLHLGYSFEYGGAGRVALQLYLSTSGRSKIGFTTLAPRPGEAPVPIGGIRSIVERSAMRYYLAIDAYLGAVSAPPAAQADKRLQAWFDGTEKYPRQLHELERAAYLEMKRNELGRQPP